MRLATLNALLLAAALPLLATTAAAKKVETVVYDFGRTTDDGTFPQDGVIAGADGNLYGTTLSGGSFGKGSIFVMTPDGAEHVVYSFSGAPNDGDQPNAALAVDKNGILYGTTMAGGASDKGTVFQFDPAHGQFEMLYSFCTQTNCADGSVPIAPLIVGKKNVLYGTTAVGGAGAVQQGMGTAFRLDPPKHGNVWKETVLYNFCNQANCADGKNPSAGRLLLASTGVLYGTTQNGQQGGVLYELDPSGGFFSIVHVFTTGGSNDGVSPKNGVIADRSGVLYGTTSAGGLNGCGTVYSYDPSSFDYEQIYSFCSQAGDPSTIYGGLALVQNKFGTALYGTGLAGGAFGHGALYSLTPPAAPGASWSEQTLYSFCSKANCKDGTQPVFATPLNFNGALYGVTGGGGTHGDGTVYRFGKK